MDRTRVIIPTIGSLLTLTEDWIFNLELEHRNLNFWKKIHPDIPTKKYYAHIYDGSRDGTFGPDNIATMLPAGTHLKIARIYIRQGSQEFDSVTFTLVKHPASKKLKGRFWAKLGDVNRIIATWDETTLPFLPAPQAANQQI